MQLSISINTLNPKNNQHQVSLYNNTAESDHVNKGNDHQLKKLSIVKQILLVSTLGNVKLTVWRIKILVLRWKELKSPILEKRTSLIWHFKQFKRAT